MRPVIAVRIKRIRLFAAAPIARTPTCVRDGDHEEIRRVQAAINENEWKAFYANLSEPANDYWMGIGIRSDSIGGGFDRLPQPMGRLHAPC
jgi:hypothetical protein